MTPYLGFVLELVLFKRCFILKSLFTCTVFRNGNYCDQGGYPPPKKHTLLKTWYLAFLKFSAKVRREGII